MFALPTLIDDGWITVFSFLDAKEFCSVLCASKHFYELAQNTRREIELYGKHFSEANRERLQRFILSWPNITSVVLKNFTAKGVLNMLPKTIQKLEFRSCSNMSLELSFPQLETLKCENSATVTFKYLPHTLTELSIPYGLFDDPVSQFDVETLPRGLTKLILLDVCDTYKTDSFQHLPKNLTHVELGGLRTKKAISKEHLIYLSQCKSLKHLDISSELLSVLDIFSNVRMENLTKLFIECSESGECQDINVSSSYPNLREIVLYSKTPLQVFATLPSTIRVISTTTRQVDDTVLDVIPLSVTKFNMAEQNRIRMITKYPTIPKLETLDKRQLNKLCWILGVDTGICQDDLVNEIVMRFTAMKMQRQYILDTLFTTGYFPLHSNYNFLFETSRPTVCYTIRITLDGKEIANSPVLLMHDPLSPMVIIRTGRDDQIKILTGKFDFLQEDEVVIHNAKCMLGQTTQECTVKFQLTDTSLQAFHNFARYCVDLKKRFQ